MSLRHVLSICTLYTVGFIVRLIFLKSHFSKILGDRIEVSTPLTAWKRAVEGITLQKQGTNPYDGDVFHESPLSLVVYNYMLSYAEEWIPIIFAVCDLLTAVALSKAAKIYLKDLRKKEGNSSKFPTNVLPLLLKTPEKEMVHLYVAAVYLLCPFSIISCGGKSTVVFQNLFLSIFIYFTCCGNWVFASVLLAISSYLSFYHVALIVPLVMYTHQKCCSGRYDVSDIIKLTSTVVLFVFTSCVLIVASYILTNSWKFLWSTYGCVLSVPDLTPNIGLFWYFFTEMFEHFRVFFLCTFQLHVFVYTIPLAIRLRQEPILLLFIHLIIIAVFKSYPCIGDVAFYFALLPIWSHLFYFMRQRFIIACVLASCTLLAPTLWHLWIYSGSANANFYFAITLAFNTGQIFLLTDILSAFIKREYYLENGVKYTDDGRLVLLRLQ